MHGKEIKECMCREGSIHVAAAHCFNVSVELDCMLPVHHHESPNNCLVDVAHGTHTTYYELEVLAKPDLVS